MRAFGSMISEMEKALKGILMETHTLASSSMVGLMVKVSIPGQMVKFMMVSGIKGLNKVMVSGEE